MRTCIVTGVAGFIGSHLAEALLGRGDRVIGVDEFNDYYDPDLKRKNVAPLLAFERFELITASIQQLDWRSLLSDVEIVFHLAAQAGVRASWGKDFCYYTERNLNATQIILEAAKDTPTLQRFVYASTSSVYGDAETLPTPETVCPKPVSPYGITKLAAEQLCWLYHKNDGVPVTALRYFSVYGPRQRPDMGFHKFFRAVLQHQPIPIYGDGQQTRDFTFVGDVVAGNLLAASEVRAIGEVFNIGGGSRVVLTTILDQIETITGTPLQRDYQSVAKGDARHTAADITKARQMLGYQPTVSLLAGLTQEWEWVRSLYA